MQALTPTQLRQISKIVEDYHKALAMRVVGPSFFDQKEVDRMVAKGLVTRGAAINYPRLAYLFGRLIASIGESAAKSLTFSDFVEKLKKQSPEINEADKAAVEIAGRNMVRHIKGLGDHFDKATGQIVLRNDKKLRDFMREEIRHRVTLAVEQKQAADDAARDIARSTGDYRRDWFKIVVTEMNNAIQEGHAEEILRKSPKKGDQRVFKRPRPDGCVHCKSHYLENDEKTPRVFHLKELQKNGDNLDLSKADWKPVVGSMHPHCRCEIHELPDGFGFDREGNMVWMGKGGAYPATVGATPKPPSKKKRAEVKLPKVTFPPGWR